MRGCRSAFRDERIGVRRHLHTQHLGNRSCMCMLCAGSSQRGDKLRGRACARGETLIKGLSSAACLPSERVCVRVSVCVWHNYNLIIGMCGCCIGAAEWTMATDVFAWEPHTYTQKWLHLRAYYLALACKFIAFMVLSTFAAGVNLSCRKCIRALWWWMGASRRTQSCGLKLQRSNGAASDQSSLWNLISSWLMCFLMM